MAAQRTTHALMFIYQKFGYSGMWADLLSSCLGYLLPNPTIKKKHVFT